MEDPASSTCRALAQRVNAAEPPRVTGAAFFFETNPPCHRTSPTAQMQSGRPDVRTKVHYSSTAHNRPETHKQFGFFSWGYRTWLSDDVWRLSIPSGWPEAGVLRESVHPPSTWMGRAPLALGASPPWASTVPISASWRATMRPVITPVSQLARTMRLNHFVRFPSWPAMNRTLKPPATALAVLRSGTT